MELFKSEPIINSNGFFVYPPKPVTENIGFTYNGVVLPPLPNR